jgi:hypothetical protein
MAVIPDLLDKGMAKLRCSMSAEDEPDIPQKHACSSPLATCKNSTKYSLT